MDGILLILLNDRIRLLIVTNRLDSCSREPLADVMASSSLNAATSFRMARPSVMNAGVILLFASTLLSMACAGDVFAAAEFAASSRGRGLP